jgi:PilZ domain-containing protein
MRRSMRAAEHQRALRFPLVVPILTDKGLGTTREVSIAGVFFEIDQPYSAGEPVTIALVLERADPDAPLHLKGVGHVVRVEPRDDKIGVAAAVTWQVAPPEPSTPPA